MKARVNATGEIIDAVMVSKGKVFDNDVYKDGNGKKYYDSRLTFIHIDWEQQRYELAKSALQGLLADSNVTDTWADVSTACIDIADEMIKQLKGE